LWSVVKKWDKKEQLLFLEQLADVVARGSCAQGRTTRILSLFYDLY
jgi:hypothetical protein